MHIDFELIKEQGLKLNYDDEDQLLHEYIEQSVTAAEDFCGVVFPDDEEAPPPVRGAVMLMASFLMEKRELAGEGYDAMRAAFERMLNPYREVTF